MSCDGLDLSRMIGSDVVVYPGARIIGNVKIGDTVVIGANAVVVDDVRSSSIAVGVPARVVRSLDSVADLGL